MNQKYFAYGGFALIAVLFLGSIFFYSSYESSTGNLIAKDASVGLNVAPSKIVACSDTDKGRTYGTKGTVTASGTAKANTFTDSCNDAEKKLIEYYCQGNQVTSETIACQTGQYCIDGACVPVKCNDPDNGRDYYEMSTVSYGYNLYKDECLSSTTIREFYCNGGSPWPADFECPSGKCVDGACIR